MAWVVCRRMEVGDVIVREEMLRGLSDLLDLEQAGILVQPQLIPKATS